MPTQSHDILLFGGAANTGLHLVRQARERGLSVACMVRAGRDISALTELGVTILTGDAFEMADCTVAVEAAQATTLISVLGGKDQHGRRIDESGNLNAINAAWQWRADARFIFVTSLGSDEQFDQLPPPVQSMLGDALKGKTVAERYLRASSLRWTIIRPAGLTHAAGAGQYQICTTVAQALSAPISRSDVALATLDLLANDAAIGQVYTVCASQNDKSQ